MSLDEFAYQEVVFLIKEGRKVEAIKMVRTLTSLGLKEAKDIVDQIAAELKLQ